MKHANCNEYPMTNAEPHYSKVTRNMSFPFKIKIKKKSPLKSNLCYAFFYLFYFFKDFDYEILMTNVNSSDALVII